MNLLRKFIIGMSTLLADIVLLSCCLYFTVIANKMEQVWPNLLLWIGLVIVGFLVNLNIVRKATHIGPIAIWNVCWMIVTAVIVAFTFTSEPASPAIKVFVCGVLVIIHGHGLTQALLTQKAETHLTLLDVLVVVFAIFLAGCHLRGITDTPGMQALGFFAVGYTLAALIFLRTAQEEGTVVKGDSIAARAKVFGLLAGIVAICCLICVSISILAKHSARSLADIFLLLLQECKSGIGQFGSLLNKSLAKLPGQDPALGDVPFISSSETLAEETGSQAVSHLPDWILPLTGVIVVALIAIFVLRLLWKLRLQKLTLHRQNYQPITVTVSAIKTKKQSLLQRFLKKWKLRIKMYRDRKTPEGLALLVRKKGKSTGIEMQPADSWHGYVEKLIPYGEETALQELSSFFKSYFYSPVSCTLDTQTYRHYVNAIRTLQKQNNNKKGTA